MLIKINLLAYWLNGLAYKQLAYGADLSTTLDNNILSATMGGKERALRPAEDDSWFKEVRGLDFVFAQQCRAQSPIVKDLMDIYFAMKISKPSGDDDDNYNNQSLIDTDLEICHCLDQFCIIVETSLDEFFELTREYDEYSVAELLDPIPIAIREWEERHGISFGCTTLEQYLDESNVVTRAIEVLRNVTNKIVRKWLAEWCY